MGRFLFLKLKLVTVSQFIVSRRYLKKELVVYMVFLDWNHTFIVLIYGFMYSKSKLIKESYFQLNPYSDRRRKNSVLLKSFRYTWFAKFQPKTVLLKKNVSKVKRIFFLLVSSQIYAKYLIFPRIAIHSYKINVMNTSNILSLASVCRNLDRGICGVKSNVFFLFQCEHILFKKRGLVYLIFPGYDDECWLRR